MHSTTDTYRHILEACVPELAIQTCELAGEGWDSVALLVNGEYIFRIAKRPDVALRLANEARLLPVLAGFMPFAIPRFEYVCDDPASGDKRLAGYRVIRGTPLTRAFLQHLPSDVSELLPNDLANFLTLLHFYPVEHAASLIVPLERSSGWREQHAAFYAEVREHIFPLLDSAEQERVAVFWEGYLNDDANFRFTPTLIHADLNPADHILCDPATGRLAGVIDWGDACVGDPALDFTGLLRKLGRDFAERVATSYQGDIDATFWRRAAFYGQLEPYHEIRFGQMSDDDSHRRHGIATLRDALLTA